METYKDYGRFREACTNFKDAFTEKYFENGKLFCHPLIDGLIYAPCSPEEAKKNTPDICRMSDMLLMSSDGEDFVPFKIAEAREIAEENGSVFITDLLFTATFEALNWMIDGKHDTLIISEEHMKKEGKPYAPVTPLTNVVQHFKKINNNFLYTKGTPEAPAVLTEKEISAKLEGYLDELVSEIPSPEIVSETEFELFGTVIVTDKNESRCAELDKALSVIDTLKETMAPNEAAMKDAGVDFTIDSYTAKLLAKAAAKCGVNASEKDFAGITENDKLKDTFKKLISEKNGYGFKYVPADKKKTVDALHAIELSSASAEEIKKDVSALMTVRPGCGAVYNLARAASPADAESIEAISEYWGCEALSIEELNAYLSENYIPETARDSEGKLCCSGTEASVITEDITAAAAKYKLKNAAVIKELTDYCSEFEIKSRTYNDTVFDSVEEMEKAVKNEKELAEKCSDLSALNEDELKKLRKYIYDMPLDKKTTGKYLLKIKLALLDCEENQLKMLCTGLTMKKPEELEALKKKISEGGFDEVKAAPYKAQIDDCILGANLKELSAMFKEIPDEQKADSLEKALASGKYDKMFTRHFSAKIADARDGFARKSLGELCKNIASADKKALDEIREKLSGITCRAALKAPYTKEIFARYDAIELDEVTKTFSVIKDADKAKLAELREIIKSCKYKKNLTEKYIPLIDERETELANAEFAAKCDGIPKMDKAALEAVTAELKSGKYPEALVNKYIPMTEARAVELVKAEIADLCKDVANMDFAKLDELEKKLAEGKYDEKLIAPEKEKITARRKVLINQEADNLAKNIPNMDKAALAQLSEKLKDAKYDAEYNKKHFAAIEARIDKLEKDKLAEMCKNIEKLKKEELEKLSADITALEMKKENKAEFLEKIRKQEISLMKSELEKLCKNIANTPRKELSKLKEALSGGGFDKELADKYIKEIDKRTDELITKELAELCKNLANAPKEKLRDMKKTIDETPEYAEKGKAYVEQIVARLKKIDKEEFDKQMASIDKLSMEELEKFTEDLEKRKPTLDAKLYEATAAKCKERGVFLEKQKLDKLTEGIADADIAKLNDMKEQITDGDFTPEITFPYIKKIDDAITDRQVQYFSKLMENINGMSRAELIILLEEVNKNESHCSDDMLQRYIGKVNAKIREADRLILDAKCKNLSDFSERRSYELIKDINDMDIDASDKRRYINQVEIHITNIKTHERNEYVEKLRKNMNENSITGVHFYVPGLSKVFESQFTAICNAFASLEQFELPVLIHEVTQGHTEDAYMMTVDYLYFKGKNGLGHIALDQIERFEVKKTLFAAGLQVVEKDGKISDLPNGIDKKALDNAAKVLNYILRIIQEDKSKAKLREAEEIRAAEEAKLREIEQERLEIEEARKKAKEPKPVAAPKPVENKPADAPKPAENKPADAPKPAENKPADAPKPVENKPADAPKPAENKPADAPKPVENKPADAPKPAENKPADAPKPAENKPADAPKPVENKPAEAPKPAAPAAAPQTDVKPIKSIKPIEVVVSPIPEVKPINPIPNTAPAAPAAKPAEAPKAEPAKPVMKMKFCDQCGSKITNENAKFCMECGNKLIH